MNALGKITSALLGLNVPQSIRCRFSTPVRANAKIQIKFIINKTGRCSEHCNIAWQQTAIRIRVHVLRTAKVIHNLVSWFAAHMHRATASLHGFRCEHLLPLMCVCTVFWLHTIDETFRFLTIAVSDERLSTANGTSNRLKTFSNEDSRWDHKPFLQQFYFAENEKREQQATAAHPVHIACRGCRLQTKTNFWEDQGLSWLFSECDEIYLVYILRIRFQRGGPVVFDSFRWRKWTF